MTPIRIWRPVRGSVRTRALLPELSSNRAPDHWAYFHAFTRKNAERCEYEFEEDAVHDQLDEPQDKPA
jgi:hypothetical protein